jgi:hypothetical protein
MCRFGLKYMKEETEYSPGELREKRFVRKIYKKPEADAWAWVDVFFFKN